MSHAQNPVRRPDVLSRDVLESTFSLLRDQHPQLALEIQNILAGDKISHYQRPQASTVTDHFHIQLSPQIIGRIVDALTRIGNSALYTSESGSLAMLRILIKDWMDLTEWIISHADPSRVTL